MKAELHPQMNVVKVHCACGNEFETLSTAPELRLEICGACHPFYTGNQKFVDAAGIGQYAYSLLRPEERDQIVHIAESRPLPSHCVVVRQGISTELAGSLRDALLALNEGPDRALLRKLYNVDGYIPVTHETYAEVEQVARRYGFIEEKR